ncbi:helix-turn-helix domain-containing protein [Kroppenstedtia pulmonis]|uniref:Helix-turn-helix domain-containing protein n=1 Tax=Kroppenstedtia pulmonis TaxID=1380685 RepID=A0A7D4CEB2_9BACL|nr:helix-turn-helix domain-containing protein [Kroppenstedtia pulmonis]QKG83754.1 helix-turn-helix domain-containing protein [Kroppenstedtia pulmonis]
MSPLDVNEIGEIIRKVRKERGLRLEDLADENISPATISNLERGVPHVRQDKLSYLLKKLDIPMETLPDLLQSEQKELKDIQLHLLAVDSLKRIGEYDQALNELNKIDLADDHPHAPDIFWQKGVCHLFKKKYKRAERELSNAIRLINNHHSSDKGNIKSYSFNDLGLCSYYQNDLQSALQYTNHGLDAFNPEGTRHYVKYLLLRNKAIYLERMGRVVEALQIVQNVWSDLSNIESLETTLAFYWLRAELLRKSGTLDEALRYAQEGIELASINYQYKSVFVLWSVLGSIYTSKKEWSKAENCFHIALAIPQKMVNTLSYIRTCTQLGILYTLQEKWDHAEKTLNQAVNEAKKRNSSIHLTSASLATGNLYYLKNEKELAASYFQQAVELAEMHHYKDKEYQGWYYLGKCWKGINEEKFRQCAENMFKVQEALNQTKAVGDFHEVQ